tara:strand:- start:14716 stop:15228 length:513 start_codon:yes stop_codon:yes gene_type:complete
MAILTQADFTGKYALSQGMYSTTKITDYIDIYEKKYLIDLLGVDLYNLFDADLVAGSGTPTEARFLVIWNALTFDYSNCVYISDGIKEMLKGYIYYEFLKDSINEMTPIGNVKPIGENSQRASTLFTTMYSRYNDAIKTSRVIQKYIDVNDLSYNYDDYNGFQKSYNYWL